MKVYVYKSLMMKVIKLDLILYQTRTVTLVLIIIHQEKIERILKICPSNVQFIF